MAEDQGQKVCRFRCRMEMPERILTFSEKLDGLLVHIRKEKSGFAFEPPFLNENETLLLLGEIAAKSVICALRIMIMFPKSQLGKRHQSGFSGPRPERPFLSSSRVAPDENIPGTHSLPVCRQRREYLAYRAPDSLPVPATASTHEEEWP